MSDGLDLNPDYLAIAAKRLAGIVWHAAAMASGYDQPPPLAAAPEGSPKAQAAGDAPGGDAGRRLVPAFCRRPCTMAKCVATNVCEMRVAGWLQW